MTRFIVSASHVSPDFALDRVTFGINRAHRANVGYEGTDFATSPRFWASLPRFGCGRDRAKPEDAIRALLLDNGCTDILIERAPEDAAPATIVLHLDDSTQHATAYRSDTGAPVATVSRRRYDETFGRVWRAHGLDGAPLAGPAGSFVGVSIDTPRARDLLRRRLAAACGLAAPADGNPSPEEVERVAVLFGDAARKAKREAAAQAKAAAPVVEPSPLRPLASLIAAASQRPTPARMIDQDTARAMLDALRSAESFMAGFEDDEMQEGINARLATVRAAITRAEAGK